MSKFILTDAYVEINGVDLSAYAFAVDTPQEREEVDVSGFNSTGAKSYLPGSKDQTVTIQMLQSFATNLVHQTLNPLFVNSSTFGFSVRPTSSAISATNPRYWGTASLYQYNALAGDISARSEIEVVLRPVTATGFVWATS